ncbi:MAG: hypothetical protein H6807_02265 [Planctomycetes bacterium]|nr:hypothetical protein [Planctomycetota bacterium]
MSGPDANPTARHRIFGFFRAPETAAAFILIVFLIFFWTWSRLAGRDDAPTAARPLGVEARCETVAEGFFVDLEADQPVYVALFLDRPGATPALLFPRLGPPPGRPWPLTAGARHRFPEPGHPFTTTLGPGERIVVVARRDRLAGAIDDLDDDPAVGQRLELEVPER